MQYDILKITFSEFKRVARYQRNWLKKHHPEIYEQLMAASKANDEAYMSRRTRKGSELMARYLDE